MRLFLAALAALGLSVGPAPAQDTSPRLVGPRLILTGRATVEAAPDYASISIGVSNRAPTTAAAIDLTSAAAAKTVAAARVFGIAPRDIQTSYISLQPAYKTVRDPNGQTEQRPDGYTASNSVTVRVRELGRLGEFLRTVVDGGANRIGGVTFEVAEPGKAELEVLAAAVRNARAQAETIAAAAGIKLGRLEEIRHGSRSEIAPRPRAYRSALAAAPARQEVPIEPGSLEFAAEVEVIYAIEQP